MASAAELYNASLYIDGKPGNAEKCWTHQPVKVFVPIPGFLEQEGRLPTKFHLTERQVAQLDWFSLKLAHPAARLLHGSCVHPRDHGWRLRRTDYERRCRRIQNQVRGKMIQLCGDDRESTPQLQRNGVL